MLPKQATAQVTHAVTVYAARPARWGRATIWSSRIVGEVNATQSQRDTLSALAVTGSQRLSS